jgi:hypothetical protein
LFLVFGFIFYELLLHIVLVVEIVINLEFSTTNCPVADAEVTTKTAETAAEAGGA